VTENNTEDDETGTVGMMASMLFVQRLIQAGAVPEQIYAALGDKRLLKQCAALFSGAQGNVFPLKAVTA
jgi:hypothetical protein